MNEAKYIRQWGRRLECQEIMLDTTAALMTWALVPLGLAAALVVWATTRPTDMDTPC